MDIAKYLELKAAGKTTIQKFGDSYQIQQRQFNPDTGVETTPKIATFIRADLVKQKEVVAKTLESIDILIADIDALG